MGPADAAVGVCLEAKAARKQQVQSEEQEAQEALGLGYWRDTECRNIMLTASYHSKLPPDQSAVYFPRLTGTPTIPAVEITWISSGRAVHSAPGAIGAAAPPPPSYLASPPLRERGLEGRGLPGSVLLQDP